MEFVEYYRILRRRIWLVVLTAGLAAAAVLATRLLPHETPYPAQGRVLLHDVAKRDINLQGNDLAIGPPDQAAQFWNAFSQFVNSRYVLEAAANDIGVTLPEAEEQLRPAQAERLGESDVAQVATAATGMPTSAPTADVSNPRELAVAFCNSVMENLDDLWRENRLARVEAVREVLEARLPEVEEQVDVLRAQADQLVQPYGGVAPTTVEQRLTDELASIESQVSASEVARGAADARADILEETARTTPGAAAAPAAQPAPNPEATALQQAIAQKQIELEEELTRRTAEHEAVKAIERQIAGLRERLARVPSQAPAAAGGTAGSLALREAAVQAEVEAAALNRRLDLLAQRASDIRTRLPQITQDARVYGEVSSRLQSTQQAYETVLDHLERLDYEEQQLTTATLVEVISPAEAQRVPTGLAGFLMRLAVAIVAGAILGILLVFVLYYVDFSFQDAHEAEMLLDVPVLAGIPRTDAGSQAVPARSAAPTAPRDDSDDDRGIL